ncbi:restriction endonuclease subunit S [Verrucomicrobiota bacterium]
MWNTAQLRDVAEVASGFGFPRKCQGRLDGEYPFYKVGDMNTPGNETHMTVANNTISADALKKLRARTFPAGTIIFPKIGAAIATNKKRKLTKASVVDNNVMGLLPKQTIDEDYLFYWMWQFDLRSVANIGPVPSMRKSEVELVSIPLPPPSEQRRIVEILDQANALRKKRAEADKIANRILPALFYKMFGDPATNPKGWDVKTLTELSVEGPQYGANASSIDWEEGQPRYIRITDVRDDGTLNEDVRGVDLDEWGEYRLREGDLLFARSGATVGKTYLYQPSDGLCVYAGYMIRFRLDTEQVEPEFVFAFTHSSLYQSWVEATRRTGGQPNINGREYAALRLIVPDRALQQTFGDRARELRKRRVARQRSGAHLESLFAVLLHRAFSGDLTARWREAHMKELLQEMEQQAVLLGQC